jgi:integrase/recombinase XerD
VIFLLSVRAGLRAKEIAALKWEMITDAEGELADVIALTNEAAKGRRGGRAIPIAKDLKVALVALKAEAASDYRNGPYVVTSERGISTSSYAVVNKFAGWYRALGFTGASSHSGRRTAITNWARKISQFGVSAVYTPYDIPLSPLLLRRESRSDSSEGDGDDGCCGWFRRADRHRPSYTGLPALAG